MRIETEGTNRDVVVNEIRHGKGYDWRACAHTRNLSNNGPADLFVPELCDDQRPRKASTCMLVRTQRTFDRTNDEAEGCSKRSFGEQIGATCFGTRRRSIFRDADRDPRPKEGIQTGILKVSSKSQSVAKCFAVLMFTPTMCACAHSISISGNPASDDVTLSILSRCTSSARDST